MTDAHLADRHQAVVVVIDIQQKLFPHIAGHEDVVRNAATLIQGAQVLDVPVRLTEQYPKGLGPTVAPIAHLLEGTKPLEKLTFGCYADPGFRQALEATGRRQVILCGIEAHICVLQTALQLLEAGFRVQVAADAVGSRKPDHCRVARDRLRHAGADVTVVESVLFEMLQNAETDAFKQIARLVR